MTNIVPCEVPMGARQHTIDVAETCGDGWWSILHAAVSGIPCTPCREHGERLFSALHDMVNAQLGKPLHDRKNFLEVARSYYGAAQSTSGFHPVDSAAVARGDMEPAAGPSLFNRLTQRGTMGSNDREGEENRRIKAGLSQRLPRCKPPQADKLEACIEDLKARGEEVNPWAVCSAEIGCSPKKSLMSEVWDIDGAQVVTVEDPEMVDCWRWGNG